MKYAGISACLLWFAASVVAAQAPDPISGTWKGDMGPDGGERFQITMQLKFDGKSAVSGTIEGNGQTAQIASGSSFNAQSGSLKIQADVQSDGETQRFVFDGTVSANTAKGSVSGHGQTGSFQVAKTPESGASNETAVALKKNFEEVSVWVAKAADMVPADKYAYKPSPSVRSFGQLVAHITDGYEFFCARAAGQNIEWSEATEKGALDKATLVSKLKQAQAKCDAAYGGNGAVRPLIGNIGHTSLHYGNIITYMRMMGMVPPSS